MAHTRSAKHLQAVQTFTSQESTNIVTEKKYFVKSNQEYIKSILNAADEKSKNIKYSEIYKKILRAEYYFFRFSNKKQDFQGDIAGIKDRNRLTKTSIAKNIYLRLMYFRSLQPLLLWIKAKIAKK